jgi:hypothetical protein
MATWECPQEWSEWMDWLGAGLHGRWRPDSFRCSCGSCRAKNGYCWRSTILPPNATAPRSRARASITTLRRDRPTRSIFTATFG